jgi:hypothetical protein
MTILGGVCRYFVTFNTLGIRLAKTKPYVGQMKSTTVPGLFVKGIAITSQCDIANALAASFASLANSGRYDPTFLRIKHDAER